MDYPELLRDQLEDGESVLASIDLGGEDHMVVTPTQALLYRAEGLLSDESVETFSLNTERIDLRSGRRKTTFELRYVDGKQDFTVPSRHTSDVLSPVLGGVLRTAGVVGADESVSGAYRFSELTLVITDQRLVRHVGGAVWDTEYEIAPFADLTGLSFEKGSVGTEVSVKIGGYPQRFKVPNEHAGSVRRALQDAVFTFHDVSSLAELDELIEAQNQETDELAESGFTQRLNDANEAEEDLPFADLTAPELDRDRGGRMSVETAVPDNDRRPMMGATQSETETTGSESSGETDTDGEQLAKRIKTLETAVSRQTKRIEHQQQAIAQLVKELRKDQ
jgi:hypothetical protein